VTHFDPGSDGAEPPSLVQLLRALIENAQLLIEAETGYWRKALAFALRRAKSVALLGVLALFFLFFTLMALVVGLLLALAPLIGAWGALGLVTALLALATGGCGWLAVRRAKRTIGLLSGHTAGENP
jgi:hypothetical protein